MHPAVQTDIQTEELPGSDYRPAGIYAPFVWLAVLIIRTGLRMGIFSVDHMLPSRPQFDVDPCRRNRQLRRARASCLSRARRHALKGRRIKPENYTPRAYAHFAYVNMMDKTISVGQFMERYIRDNDLSRVQVYGLDSAHWMKAFTAGASEMFIKASAGAGDFIISPASLAVPDPP